jgi:nucleotide-binding universal stress UspA family protein
MTRNIVVGVDGSDNSLIALNTAADLAIQTDARLSVVFVHEPRTGAPAVAYNGGVELYVEQTEAELEATSRERAFHLLANRPVEWTFDVVVGEAVHELVHVAKARSAWLIIVGGRGHSLLGGLVLGSVAQKLVRSSPISVLVVRNPDIDDRPARLRQSTLSSPPPQRS